jgi:hypothetical protein
LTFFLFASIYHGSDTLTLENLSTFQNFSEVDTRFFRFP